MTYHIENTRIIHTASGETVGWKDGRRYLVRSQDPFGARIIKRRSLNEALATIWEQESRLHWRWLGDMLVYDGWGAELEIRKIGDRWRASRCDAPLIDAWGFPVRFDHLDHAKKTALAHFYETPAGSTLRWDDPPTKSRGD